MSNNKSLAQPAAQGGDDARDAARYRWLRSQGTRAEVIDRTLYETISDDCNPPYRAMKHGADLDAAIDAALAPQRKERGE